MDFIVATLDVVGVVLIGWAALSVHHRVLHERKIDPKVVTTMKLEQKLGALGIILIVVGYIMHWLG